MAHHRGDRREFTTSENNHLVEYLATEHPDKKNRSGNRVFEELVSNAGDKWPWSKTHSAQSWRNHYVKDEKRFDRKINKFIKEHEELEERGPEPTAGQDVEITSVKVKDWINTANPIQLTEDMSKQVSNNRPVGRQAFRGSDMNRESNAASPTLEDRGIEGQIPPSSIREEPMAASGVPLKAPQSQSHASQTMTPPVSRHTSVTEAHSNKHALRNREEEREVEKITTPSGTQDLEDEEPIQTRHSRTQSMSTIPLDSSPLRGYGLSQQNLQIYQFPSKASTSKISPRPAKSSPAPPFRDLSIMDSRLSRVVASSVDLTDRYARRRTEAGIPSLLDMSSPNGSGLRERITSRRHTFGGAHPIPTYQVASPAQLISHPPSTILPPPTETPIDLSTVSDKDLSFATQIGLHAALESIGRNHGFTKERVREIWEKCGDLERTDEILTNMRRAAEEIGERSLNALDDVEASSRKRKREIDHSTPAPGGAHRRSLGSSIGARSKSRLSESINLPLSPSEEPEVTWTPEEDDLIRKGDEGLAQLEERKGKHSVRKRMVEMIAAGIF
ncbi:hypothetical protein SISSUDRAFT_1129792 [Sistotremastrum suecicum HHB10207 ss-3]|uniref:TERF2-interacting telomeric protein 1 Myb domain-containing protein n=1 Tax=Sistotremastrum suecicum HHB10207 ss-3 TaxID=1314776 RepID=A0A166C9I9_9AGAM|nr:hypothetical protein SISSUDRAFT_1129792 [Sistotremastrum suecicum HHB10207 ss-3]